MRFDMQCLAVASGGDAADGDDGEDRAQSCFLDGKVGGLGGGG